MQTYIMLVTWTDQGAKTVHDTVTRVERNEEVIRKLGGRDLGTYWTQGAYDLVLVREWPDEEAANAFAMHLAYLESGDMRKTTWRQ